MTTIADLQPDPRNANKGTERGRHLLEKSLSSYGAGRSILLDKNGKIIAGNKTAEVAAAIGLDDVVIVESDGTKLIAVQRTDIDLDTEAGRMMAYADNRVGQVDLDFDIEEIIADANAGLPLDDFWFESEIDQMIAEMVGYEPPAPGDAEPQANRAEELRRQWQTETGQLWRLPSRDGKGEHRLIVGDCTDREVVERVMGGERADIAFTSPPYNAGVSAQLSGNTSIDDNLYREEYDDNKNQSDYLELLKGFTDNALLVCEYVFVNIQTLAGNKRAFVDYWHNYSDVFCDVAIWDKGRAAPQQAQRVMDSRFEFVLVFGGNGSRAIGTRIFRGMVHNVYEGTPQRHNENADIHAATMPIDLPEHFIKTFTNSGKSIYEPFCGTGTTLIACENLNRYGRAVEISPAYCAVILQRYQDAFGITAELIT